MPVIRSISGLRATLGDSLSPTSIAEYCLAFSSIMPDGAIVVGRDGRPSGEWIEHIVVGALTACGRTVHIAGIVPTPTVQLLTEHSSAVAGIIITASHNPAEWNGLKFIGGDGVFLDKEQNSALWNALDSQQFSLSSEQQSGCVEYIEKPLQQHIDAIFALPFFTNDIREQIRQRRLRIVVDAVNCSGSVVVPELLRLFGCEVIELFCDASGVFPHTPEPLPENLTLLCNAVLEHKADLGFAIDPDADRLVIIGSNGVAIGEEKTVMLAIEAVFRYKSVLNKTTANNIAVVNLSTSRMARDAAERNGGRLILAPVGEINVVRAMQHHSALVGGEGSGGVIVPACHFGRDSLVGCALVILLAGTLSPDDWSRIAESTPYAMIKTKHQLTQVVQPIFARVANTFVDAEIDISDGIRCDWSDRWVQIRASNTEPIVRIIAEAPRVEQAKELVDSVTALMQ